jgi:hypothetical protein
VRSRGILRAIPLTLETLGFSTPRPYFQALRDFHNENKEHHPRRENPFAGGLACAFNSLQLSH